MGELVKNIEISDDLDCWWSPGQWIRIIYGVWVDQLWYWQTVRPRMKGRTIGWGIFVQALLGTILTAAIVVLGISQLLILQNIPVNPKLMVLGFGIALGVLILIGGIAGIIGGVGASVPPTVVLGVLLVAGSLAGNVKWDLVSQDWKAISSAYLIFAVLGLVFGIARSVVEGEISLLEMLIESTLIGIGMDEDLGIGSGIITGAAVCMGILAGMKWATRQVAEKEERKKLAKGSEQ